MSIARCLFLTTLVLRTIHQHPFLRKGTEKGRISLAKDIEARNRVVEERGYFYCTSSGASGCACVLLGYKTSSQHDSRRMKKRIFPTPTALSLRELMLVSLATCALLIPLFTCVFGSLSLRIGR